jgi:hypothetical protein
MSRSDDLALYSVHIVAGAAHRHRIVLMTERFPAEVAYRPQLDQLIEIPRPS